MKTLLTTACLAAVLCATVVAAEKKHQLDGRSPMAAMLADKSGAEFEAAFLAMMIHHHKGGEPMWALAKEKSKDETILALEKKTVPKEKKEIEQMTAWLSEWHKKSPQDFKEPEESRQMMERDMADLKAASGHAFDASFAEKMAHHHMGAIEMAKLAEGKSEHAEVKDLAEKIASAQAKDRDTLLKIAKHHK
jgi:uncharacterized protein (DUF305 family)